MKCFAFSDVIYLGNGHRFATGLEITKSLLPQPAWLAVLYVLQAQSDEAMKTSREAAGGFHAHKTVNHAGFLHFSN